MKSKVTKKEQTSFQDKGIYYRIGTQYFKEVSQPLISGEEVRRIVQWNSEAIKLDYGKDFLDSCVNKLDGFCLIPSHFNYQQIINGKFFNKYHPFLHKPSNEKYPSITISFLNHIFGEQINLGLDYLKLLLLQPTQQLPILCLVSIERDTGKSTFLNWLKAIFGDNMTINSNENFASQFNSDWMTKLIIAAEEALLNKKEDSERFKNLSTAKTSKLESKGVDRIEIEFFGKFILCSNNEDSFIYMDKEEIRYWVRKIPVIQEKDTEALLKLVEEIPFFLAFILERPYSTEKKTRMWFTPKQITTPALLRLKKSNQNKLETELANFIITIIDNLPDDDDSIDFCLGDSQNWLKRIRLNSADSQAIKRILQDKWKLKPKSNSNGYVKWLITSDGTICSAKAKGRFYTMTKKNLIDLNFFDDSDDTAVST
ncbi:MAG: primase-helicase family protein [Ginsengibacter sp.]